VNLEEIKQAVAKLSPDDFIRFREWFKNHESHVNAGNSKQIEEKLKRLQGSLKGTGAVKTLMEERRKESLM
jgi:hypothetical protein